MKLQLARLRLAALVAIACTASTTLAYDAPEPRKIVVAWSPPTQNSDGTPLTDLQGYVVYTGFAPESMIPLYFVNAPNSGILLTYWDTRTRYFGVSAVNVDGVESSVIGPVSWPQ